MPVPDNDLSEKKVDEIRRVSATDMQYFARNSSSLPAGWAAHGKLAPGLGPHVP